MEYTSRENFKRLIITTCRQIMVFRDSIRIHYKGEGIRHVLET